jgi:two-component system, NarL family, sensor kinase
MVFIHLSQAANALVFLILMSIFILTMVGFIINILFFVQKKQKGFTNDLIAVKANYDKELFRAQLEIQEQTFQDISREIHDNVGQVLSLAKLGLSTLDFDRKEESKESISEINDILEKALDDLRHMSRSLNTELVKKGGLKKSIDKQVGFLQRGGKYKIQYQVTGESIHLNETKEIILFRILQEAVNNILRHSSATEIRINLCYEKDFLTLQIEDNGTGFCMENQELDGDHINGIYNMQHRAKLIKADFNINSELSKGTKITVNTPY